MQIRLLEVSRVGEFARCGVLSRYDNVAFPKALGTVVTERAVDIVIVILMAVFAILTQIKVFTNFFFKTSPSLKTYGRYYQYSCLF